MPSIHIHQPNTAQQNIRQPHYADDLWYSSITPQLMMDVQADLDTAADLPTVDLPLRGLMTPHSGHLFSGHVLAAAYTILHTQPFEQVAILGFEHRPRTDSPFTVVEATTWQNPLGKVEVAQETLQKLNALIPLTWIEQDDREPSIELQLPFLQMTLKKFRLIPLHINTIDPNQCAELASALHQTLSANTLVIASTDLSHYYDDATARQLDQQTLKLIRNCDSAGLLAHAQQAPNEEQPYLCSLGPVLTLLAYLAPEQTNLTVDLRRYQTTADRHPIRRERVLGFAAMSWTQPNP